MFKSVPKPAIRFAFVALAFVALCATSRASISVNGYDVGTLGHYNYSPAEITVGNMQYFWWCSYGINPNDPSQPASDVIKYESINLSTGARVGPEIVLGETPGGWDSVYSCNPSAVVRGVFTNPLGNGTNYTYVMYYVGTKDGVHNNIGAAFSNDGITWTKDLTPVITHNPNDNGYGVAQPSAWNTNGASNINLFYENTYPSEGHWEAASTDGVHFTTQGEITTNGLNQVGIAGQSSYTAPTWSAYAEDYDGNGWAIFNMPGRPPATTGGVIERGQGGMIVYKIPYSSLLTGATPWTQVFTVDTNLTGYESNFLGGFQHDSYGNIQDGYTSIVIFPAASLPRPAWDASPGTRGSSAGTSQWDLVWDGWTPGAPLVPFQRYYNGTTHEVTTGWVDPNGSWTLQGTEGYLYESPQSGATVPLYGCISGDYDYFVSLASDCENEEGAHNEFLGINGYVFSSSGFGRVALYRCNAGTKGNFVSEESNCEGYTEEELLGYAESSE
jgi:hypothetical protein